MPTAPFPLSEYLARRPGQAGRHLKYFFNGTIHSMNPAAPAAPHMLVAGSRIWSCSSDPLPLGLDFRRAGFSDSVARLSPDVDFIDLERATVIPGMVDCHVHVLWWALNATRADLSTARSESECIGILRGRAAGLGRGQWLVGFGWSHNAWEDARLPSRTSLDQAFPDNPVFLSSKCGHLAWVNSAALAAGGVDESSADPPGGAIERQFENGVSRLTGILKEAAIGPVESAIGTPSREAMGLALREGQRRAHAMGLTGVQTPEDLGTWEMLQAEHAAGNLTMRVSFWIPASALEHLCELRVRAGLGDDRLEIGAVKVFTDGSLGGRTAWMYEPVEGEPDNFGICCAEPSEIRRIALKANRAGIPAAIHAIGDRAVGAVLEAYESVADELRGLGLPPLANRIEHLQLVAPRDTDLLRRVRPVASVQPVHLCADMGPADRLWGTRSCGAYAFKTLADAGCLLAFGSDAPVEPINPFLGVFAATTRQTLGAQPEGGWYPEERISRLDALAAYTVNAAGAAGHAGRLGDLSPGKLADFVILPEDPLSISAMDLIDLAPIATFTGGECVYPN